MHVIQEKVMFTVIIVRMLSLQATNKVWIIQHWNASHELWHGVKLTNYPRFVLYIILNIYFIQTLANYMHANNDALVFNLHLSLLNLVQHDI